MAGEIQVPLNATGWTVYALVRNTVGQPYRTDTQAFGDYVTAQLANYAISLTEQGTASQYYVGTMPAVAAGVYTLTLYRQSGASPAEGDTVVGHGSIEWDGSAVVPLSSRLPTSSYTAPLTAADTRSALGMAAADLDDQLDAIAAQTALIGSAEITVVSPVTADGDMTVIWGDDYLHADGRAFSWSTSSESTWPDLTGASLAFSVYNQRDEEVLTATPTVTTATGATKAIRLELPASKTDDLDPKAYRFRIVATLNNGHVVTLVQATYTVSAKEGNV